MGPGLFSPWEKVIVAFGILSHSQVETTSCGLDLIWPLLLPLISEKWVCFVWIGWVCWFLPSVSHFFYCACIGLSSPI